MEPSLQIFPRSQDRSYPEPWFANTTFPMTSRPRVSIIIPTLNEAGNMPYVLGRLPDEWIDEVILVDGRSTDSTVEVARGLRPDIKVVMEYKKGKGAALRAGMAAATGEILVMLDGDGSTDPKEIPAFVGALLAGADFAKGSRFLQGGGTADMPFYRQLGNWGLTTLVRLLFGGNYSDLCYGYNAFWRRILTDLELTGDGFEIETVLNIRVLSANFKIAEVPSFEYKRNYGVGKLQTFPDGWRVLTTIFKERINHRKVAEVTEHKPVVVDQFTPAIQLLLREAKHLVRLHYQLSTDAYQSACEAVDASYRALLELEVEHPDGKQLQDAYHQLSQHSLMILLEEHTNLTPASALAV